MKLKRKILLLSVLPVIILGAVLYFIATAHVKEGIYQQAYQGMHATALGIRDIFEVGNAGEYHLDDDNQLWKGDSLNISQATFIVDQIKTNTDLEVSVFYNDIRYLTTIMSDKGIREINTKALPVVAKTVLEDGKDYYASNVDILGHDYVVYYIPIYQEMTKTPVGMIFIGTKQATVNEVLQDMQSKLMLFSILLIAAFSVATSLLANQIMKPLASSVAAVNKIANGNLDVTVKEAYKNRKDEIGDLCRSVAHLDSKLTRIISTIKKNSDALLDSSGQLEVTAKEASTSIGQVDFVVQEIATSSGQQALSTEEAAHTVTFMGEMVEDTMKTIQDLNTATNKMKQSSDAAKDTLVSLNASMGNVMEVISGISEQTNKTNDSVIKISEAANMITAIAKQTNLLALNASIEASRAGDQGRGFAVVATEIKHLSAQSNQSATEIQAILGQLTENSSHAVELMQDAKVTIAKQKDSIHSTVEVFDTVQQGIELTACGIQNISEKTGVLDTARVKTVKNVDSLTAIAEENAAGTEEAAASVEEVRKLVQEVATHANGLNEIAEGLKSSIDVFQI